MISTIGRWIIDHQPEVTRECYKARPEESGCDCADCRNFMSQLDNAFPQEFLVIAKLLGLDIRKPAELCHFGQDYTRLYLTGGWFHVVGDILSGNDAYRQLTKDILAPDFEILTPRCSFGFTNNCALIPKSFDNKHFIQIEFMTHVARTFPDSEYFASSSHQSLIPNP